MKRMIDNKEFNKLLKDVNELNEKVDNIETIPTITIESSQFTDETHFTLTEEQLLQLKGQAVVKFILTNSIFTGLQRDLIIAQYYSYICIAISGGSDNQELIARRIDFNQETGEAEITIINVGGKQRYQHNITIIESSGTPSNVAFKINNDSNVALTYTDIRKYLYDNGFTSQNNLYEASGTAGSNNNAVRGLYANTTDILVAYYNGANTFISSTPNILNDIRTPA